MNEPGKMHFRRMDEGTDADFAVLAKVHEENIRKLPGLLLRRGLLRLRLPERAHGDVRADGPPGVRQALDPARVVGSAATVRAEPPALQSRRSIFAPSTFSRSWIRS